MFLSEVFEQLTYGELAHIKLGGLDSNGICVADYPKIINNINLALIEIYTVLPIETSQVNLQLYEEIGLYTLHSDFAETNTESVEDPKYILDETNDPFTNDILLITNVFNEAGDEYPINEINEEFSVFTPSYNTIQVPFSQDTNAVDIIYRAAPTLIPTTGVDPATTWVPIPYQLSNALISYVLHKIFSTINVGENNQAGIYYNKYLAAIELVKHVGLTIVETNLNEKLDINGWV